MSDNTISKSLLLGNFAGAQRMRSGGVIANMFGFDLATDTNLACGQAEVLLTRRDTQYLRILTIIL